MHTSIVTKCGIFLGGWGGGGMTQQWEDFHFTKENCQNYGRCTTQNLMQQSKQLEIPPVPCQYILLLMSFIQQYVQIHLNTILTQGISIIFIDQMQTYLVFKKVHSMLASKIFSSLPPSETVKCHKAKFKAALRKYLNAHCVHSVDEYFVCEDDL
jgi:hypothetical protein